MLNFFVVLYAKIESFLLLEKVMLWRYTDNKIIVKTNDST